MSGIQNVSRRGFLKGALSGGALVLGTFVVPASCWGSQRQTTQPITRFSIQMYLLVSRWMGRFTSLRIVLRWETEVAPLYLVSWLTN